MRIVQSSQAEILITFNHQCRLKYLIDPHSADLYWAAMIVTHFSLQHMGEFTVRSKLMTPRRYSASKMSHYTNW